MPIFTYEIEQNIIRKKLVSVQATDSIQADAAIEEAINEGKIELTSHDDEEDFPDVDYTIVNAEKPGKPDIIAENFEEDEEEIVTINVNGKLPNGTVISGEVMHKKDFHRHICTHNLSQIISS